MLVLTRKPGESIVFPVGNITVTIVSVRGNRVKLGIVAPPETAVHRLELWGRLRLQDAEGELPAVVDGESAMPRPLATAT
jgi:carbon storage regulator